MRLRSSWKPPITEFIVIPAKAGIRLYQRLWIPALRFATAGMTDFEVIGHFSGSCRCSDVFRCFSLSTIVLRSLVPGIQENQGSWVPDQAQPGRLRKSSVWV